jgi:hypothetical protein
MAPLKTISQAASLAITSARILGGGRYLLIPAFVGYQAVYNLLPDAVLVLGSDTLLPAFLNRGQAMLEGVQIAGRSAPAFDSTFAWNACHSYPESYRMIFVYSIRDMFICSLAKTFGHLSDRWKKPKRYKSVTMEHYISSKAFVSLIGSTRFPSAPTSVSRWTNRDTPPFHKET